MALAVAVLLYLSFSLLTVLVYLYNIVFLARFVVWLYLYLSNKQFSSSSSSSVNETIFTETCQNDFLTISNCLRIQKLSLQKKSFCLSFAEPWESCISLNRKKEKNSGRFILQKKSHLIIQSTIVEQLQMVLATYINKDVSNEKIIIIIIIIKIIFKNLTSRIFWSSSRMKRPSFSM